MNKRITKWSPFALLVLVPFALWTQPRYTEQQMKELFRNAKNAAQIGETVRGTFYWGLKEEPWKMQQLTMDGREAIVWRLDPQRDIAMPVPGNPERRAIWKHEGYVLFLDNLKRIYYFHIDRTGIHPPKARDVIKEGME